MNSARYQSAPAVVALSLSFPEISLPVAAALPKAEQTIGKLQGTSKADEDGGWPVWVTPPS